MYSVLMSNSTTIRLRRIDTGLYESPAGHLIESVARVRGESPGRADGWFVTFPGQVAPDEWYPTLLDARNMLAGQS